MNENYYKYIETRLYDWALWFSKDRNGLDYPSCSMEYLLMQQKIRGQKNSPGYIQSNPEAEEIEELVREMAGYNMNMAHSLRLQYFINGGTRFKSQQLKMSHVLFQKYVEMARQWIAGCLIGYNKSR